LIRALALDTSTWWGGTALVQRDSADVEPEVVAELGVALSDSHAIHILASVELLLKQAAWERSSLDLVVATRGPGSFTGIRVGLGTVRGLALAIDRPCVGVVTLEAMAEAFGPAERSRVPVLAAGRGEIYAARYDADSSPPVEERAPWLGAPETMLAGLQTTGAVVFGAKAATSLAPADELLRPGATPRGIAAGAGRLALLRDTSPAVESDFTPLYLRPPDALLKRR